MTLESAGVTADIITTDGTRRLRVSAADPAALAAFDGSTDSGVLEGPLTSTNARALQDQFPALRPRLIGEDRVSVGTGDRVGLATAGQVAAFRDHGEGVMPVLAQQSIREMDRLGRSARTVMDEAVFGLVEAGWDRGFGADCDHIKTTEGIDRGLDAGFTMFTLDPGDYVQDTTAGVTQEQIDALDWDALRTTPEDLRARYAGTQVDLGDQAVDVTEDDVMTAIAKYGGAVAETMRLERHLRERATHPIEVEVAVDETAWQTTFFEHHFMAAELQRLGAQWFSFAPRYVDGFEKGLDFLGDVDELRTNLEAHHAISEQFGGYKISLHSGSDKFSIYPLCMEATDGHVHLKTSGTSYLCGVQVVAAHDPELFAHMWEISRASYARAKASYQVSAQEDRTPTDLSGVDTIDLLQSPDARQILHVGYGDSLNATLPDGTPLRDRFLAVITAHQQEHTAVVAEHIGRHLTPFAAR
ncbi:MAG: tagaturonate epimerase family protein [Brachybacterium sp.]|nr:tagaturonate epimerase family protein [Brachybacterium sp.]